MSAALPQADFERIFAFIRSGKTGLIEMAFRAGRLTSYKIVEYCRVEEAGTGVAAPAELDHTPPLGQDSVT